MITQPAYILSGSMRNNGDMPEATARAANGDANRLMMAGADGTITMITKMIAETTMTARGMGMSRLLGSTKVHSQTVTLFATSIWPAMMKVDMTIYGVQLTPLMYSL